MKKLLTTALVLLFLFALVGCNEQTDIPLVPEETPPTVADLTSEPTVQASQTPTNTEPGVIVGDILFDDIPISRLFTAPFIDILGEPIEQSGASFSYEGLLVQSGNGDLVGYDNMAIQLGIFEPSLSLFELNGISSDATRAELITAFGIPHHESHPLALIYRVSNPTIEYMVHFWFRDWDEDSSVSNISIFRIASDEVRPIVSAVTPEQLVGKWQNDLGEILMFPDANYTPAQWVMYATPIGAYRIYAIADCGAHSTFWLFPVGVEMIRYNTNGSLVPSDTSVVRLYQHSFDVTTCCPDEEILLELFYRTIE